MRHLSLAALCVLPVLPATGAHPPLAVVAELPMPAPVVDVAFAGDGRVVAAMDGGLALLRLDPRRGLALVDERPLAVSSVVRAPAAILVPDPGGDTCWVTTNQAEGAILYSLEGDRLWEVQRAAVLPWPGAPRGVAFRAGTNLIDLEVAGLGAGPFVRIGRSWAIGNDGRLGIAGAGWTEARVGSSAAPAGDGALLASGPEPPGPTDRLVSIALPDGSPAAAVEMAGTVTALATRDDGTVVAGILREGAARLLVLRAVDAAR